MWSFSGEGGTKKPGPDRALRKVSMVSLDHRMARGSAVALVNSILRPSKRA
jgi:hypothetical protein